MIPFPTHFLDTDKRSCFPQTKELPRVESIAEAAVLLNLGDSVTTDHISPAGSIARTSPAAKYLAARGSVPVYHSTTLHGLNKISESNMQHF